MRRRYTTLLDSSKNIPEGLSINENKIDYQKWPKEGTLYNNMNLSLDCLKSMINDHDGKIEIYVLNSIKKFKIGDTGSVEFIQNGCGPNFQGGVLTQCTCRHDIRARHDCWREIWIAGFTKYQHNHYLVYLMKVEKSFDSYKKMWSYLDHDVRSAKNARHHVCGDIFEPISEYIVEECDPNNYHSPVDGHKHMAPSKWHKDINYIDRHGKRTRYLVGENKFSYLWSKPLVHMGIPFSSPRNVTKRSGIQELLLELVDSK